MRFIRKKSLLIVHNHSNRKIKSVSTQNKQGVKFIITKIKFFIYLHISQNFCLARLSLTIFLQFFNRRNEQTSFSQHY